MFRSIVAPALIAFATISYTLTYGLRLSAPRFFTKLAFQVWCNSSTDAYSGAVLMFLGTLSIYTFQVGQSIQLLQITLAEVFINFVIMLAMRDDSAKRLNLKKVNKSIFTSIIFMAMYGFDDRFLYLLPIQSTFFSILESIDRHSPFYVTNAINAIIVITQEHPEARFWKIADVFARSAVAFAVVNLVF